MGESQSHKSRKRKAAGKTGRTEVPLPHGKLLDALSGTDIATEIERGGPEGIKRAVGRLKVALDSGIARKVVLTVPEANMRPAYREMRRQRVGGLLTNLGGTKRIHVPKRRK